MYKCTTGMVQSNAFGCIMADEMGLGKTVSQMCNFNFQFDLLADEIFSSILFLRCNSIQ